MKILKILFFLFMLVLLLAIIHIIGDMNLDHKLIKQVKVLFSQSKNISKQKFNYKQLEGLPVPVQRYFKHVLKDGQRYISYVRLKHDGQFKTDLKNDWVNITGEQYFTTEKPGFIWQGTTSMFIAKDMYLADKGRLVVTIFSLFNVVDAQGEQYNQGELLRWLGESILFPTNLLPSKNLQWLPVDSLTANLKFNYNGIDVNYLVSFNSVGEITQFETKRYMDKDKLETWIGKSTNYKEVKGIKIPTTIEAIWKLNNIDYSYAKFHITKIEYDKPVKY